MKKEIKSFFKKNAGMGIKATELAKRLRIDKEYEYSAMKAALHDLVDENYLEKSGKRYKLNIAAEGKLIGTIMITDKGFGFVTLQNGNINDIFIAARNLGTAFSGDTVEVALFAKQKGKNLEGQVVNILKRGREEIIGELHKTNSFYFVIPSEKEIHRDIYIADRDLNGAKTGDKVVIHEIDWKNHLLNPEGKIKEVLGKSGSYDTEIAALAREFNLPYIFSKQVLKEARKIGHQIPQEEYERRLDLRDQTVFTIDPVDAKDFDDAVSLVQLDNGNFQLGVHIADVSHYVENRSHLDNEALKRGNSVYFVGKVIPMLPEQLSTDICSLVPYEDRLTYSVIAELTPSGKIESYQIEKTVINSKRRFNYDEAQDIIEKQSGDFYQELTLMNKLAGKLRKKRMSKGSINFISPEVQFQLDQNGTPVGITKKVQKESNMLIEEFMLLANQVVAKHIGGARKKNPVPFIYRVHDLPDQEKVIEFSKFVKSLGYSFNAAAANKTKEFQKLLDAVEGTEEEALINEVAIRSMAKAVYSPDNIGHYGLGFRHYTHFTSPIRRYSDLIVHRLLFYFTKSKKNDLYTYDELEEISDHISATERNAISAERLSVKIKQAEFLKNHIGEEFHAVINGVTHFGMFVELTQTLAEGLIKMRDLEDDFYVYDEKNYSLIGRRTKKRYRLGDKVLVRLIRVDLEKREVDFMIVNENY